MKTLHKVLLTALTAAASTFAGFCADSVDAEGYPMMYLRGTFNGWGVEESCRFDRSGNTYSLTVASLNGEFKVGGDDWRCNFGSNTGYVADVASSAYVEGAPNGPNFNAVNLSNLTIRFDLDRDNTNVNTTITFLVDGKQPQPQGVSGTLPILYINVYTDAEHTSFDNEIIDKDLAHKEYFSNSEYWLDLNGCEWLADLGAESVGSREEPLPLEIKARGNWTRIGFSKKPFKLKLGAKQKLLGMTKSKHYAILAHADDYWGYMRNFTGFSLGQRIGLPWTPQQQPVEVVINGDYRGLYFLTESIRIEKDRVNITELADLASDPAEISGGYLVELDNYDEDNQIQMPEKSCVGGHYLDVLRVTFDTPEEYSDLQRRFVTDQFTAMNDAVGACSDELWSYLDLDDAVRYYLVEEIISHTESFHGSTYLFRDRGEGQKWHFSPLWDCGNAFSGSTDGFFYDGDPFGNTWIPSIRTNAKFNAKLQETWNWFMTNGFVGFDNDLADYADHISAAAIADRARWKDRPVPSGGIGVCDNSDMAGRLEAVRNHLNGKINWLKGQFGDYTTVGTAPEPVRDDTPAAALPEYAQTGVEDVTVDHEAAAEYFTLTGIRVASPQAGTLYIVRRGSNVTKEIFR